jgi:hypothetical protein
MSESIVRVERLVKLSPDHSFYPKDMTSLFSYFNDFGDGSSYIGPVEVPPNESIVDLLDSWSEYKTKVRVIKDWYASLGLKITDTLAKQMAVAWHDDKQTISGPGGAYDLPWGHGVFKTMIFKTVDDSSARAWQIDAEAYAEDDMYRSLPSTWSLSDIVANNGWSNIYMESDKFPCPYQVQEDVVFPKDKDQLRSLNMSKLDIPRTYPWGADSKFQWSDLPFEGGSLQRLQYQWDQAYEDAELDKPDDKPRWCVPWLWEMHKQSTGMYGITDDLIGAYFSYTWIPIPGYGLIGAWEIVLRNLYLIGLTKKQWHISDILLKINEWVAKGTLSQSGGRINIIDWADSDDVPRWARKLVSAVERLIESLLGYLVAVPAHAILATINWFAKRCLICRDRFDDWFPIIKSQSSNQPIEVDFGVFFREAVPWVVKHLPMKWTPLSRINLDDLSVRAGYYFRNFDWNLYVRKPPFYDWVPDLEKFTDPEIQVENDEGIRPVRIIVEVFLAIAIGFATAKLAKLIGPRTISRTLSKVIHTKLTVRDPMTADEVAPQIVEIHRRLDTIEHKVDLLLNKLSTTQENVSYGLIGGMVNVVQSLVSMVNDPHARSKETLSDIRLVLSEIARKLN